MDGLIELIKSWDASFGEYFKLAITILGIIGVSIDLTPWVKIQPIRALLKWLCKQLGKAINVELYEKIDKMNDHIDTIDGRIDNLEKRFDASEASTKKYRMTSLHDRIFQMHRFFMSRGKIGVSDLENFNLCVEEYEANGGNGTVKKKIEPEVLALPVDYTDAELFDEDKAERL